MQIQIDINSDVAMTLDSMPMYEHSRKDIEEATRKTNEGFKERTQQRQIGETGFLVLRS